MLLFAGNLWNLSECQTRVSSMPNKSSVDEIRLRLLDTVELLFLKRIPVWIQAFSEHLQVSLFSLTQNPRKGMRFSLCHLSMRLPIHGNHHISQATTTCTSHLDRTHRRICARNQAPNALAALPRRPQGHRGLPWFRYAKRQLISSWFGGEVSRGKYPSLHDHDAIEFQLLVHGLGEKWDWRNEKKSHMDDHETIMNLNNGYGTCNEVQHRIT